MIIKKFIKILTNDFPAEYKKLVDQLAGILNDYLDSQSAAMTNQLSLADNLYCEIREISIKLDANYKPIINTSMKLQIIQGRIQGLQVIQVVNEDNIAIGATAAPYIDFTQNESLVTVNKIVGLPINYNFRVKLIVWG